MRIIFSSWLNLIRNFDVIESVIEDVPRIYTHARESYRRRLRPLLLYLCDVFRALINSLPCGVIESVLNKSFERTLDTNLRKYNRASVHFVTLFPGEEVRWLR